MESEASTGLLGAFTGTLALGTVFSLGFLRGLPGHIVGGVVSAIAERPNVVDGISDAFARGLASSRTGIFGSELVLGSVGSQDSAMRIPSTRLAPLSCKGCNGEQYNQ